MNIGPKSLNEQPVISGIKRASDSAEPPNYRPFKAPYTVRDFYPMPFNLHEEPHIQSNQNFLSCQTFEENFQTHNSMTELPEDFESQLKQVGLSIKSDFNLEKDIFKFDFDCGQGKSIRDFIFFSQTEYQDWIGQCHLNKELSEKYHEPPTEYFVSKKVEEDLFYTFKNPLSGPHIKRFIKMLKADKLDETPLATFMINKLANISTLKWNLEKAFIKEKENMHKLFSNCVNPDHSKEYLTKNLDTLVAVTRDAKALPDMMKINSQRRYSKLSSNHMLEIRANSKGREKFNFNLWSQKSDRDLKSSSCFLVKELLTWLPGSKKPYHFIQHRLLSSNSVSLDHHVGAAVVRKYLPGSFDEEFAVQCLHWAQTYIPENPIRSIGDASIGWGNRAIAAASWSKIKHDEVTYYGVDPQYSDNLYSARLNKILSFCSQWNPLFSYTVISGESQKTTTLDLWRSQKVMFDTVLSSPPYLATEKYFGCKDSQAYNKFSSKDQWTQFYIDYVTNFMSLLRPGGVFMLNVPAASGVKATALWAELNKILKEQFQVVHELHMRQQINMARSKAKSGSVELMYFIRKDNPIPMLLTQAKLQLTTAEEKKDQANTSNRADRDTMMVTERSDAAKASANHQELDQHVWRYSLSLPFKKRFISSG